MQRPANFGTRSYLTDEEFAQRAKQAQRQSESDSEEFAPATGPAAVTINPPGYWQEHGKPDHQASLVVDPPDGRIPPLTPEGQKFVRGLRGEAGARVATSRQSRFPGKTSTSTSRCITRGLVSSMLPTLYNFREIQILQAPGYVVHPQRNDPRNPSDSRWTGGHMSVPASAPTWGIRADIGRLQHASGGYDQLQRQDRAPGADISACDVARLTERFTRTRSRRSSATTSP